MTNAWAGGGDFEIPQQMQMPFPVLPEDNPWYSGIDVLEIFLEMGMWGWIGLGCFLIGAITVLCFFIGRGQGIFGKFIPIGALLKRLFRTWKNLLKGE